MFHVVHSVKCYYYRPFCAGSRLLPNSSLYLDVIPGNLSQQYALFPATINLLLRNLPQQ
jgi:hypothetical protein